MVCGEVSFIPQVGCCGHPKVDSGFPLPYKVLSSPLSSRQAKGNPDGARHRWCRCRADVFCRSVVLSVARMSCVHFVSPEGYKVSPRRRPGVASCCQCRTSLRHVHVFWHRVSVWQRLTCAASCWSSPRARWASPCAFSLR
jgi:hypothetical protein